jgi:hypothetical protein
VRIIHQIPVMRTPQKMQRLIQRTSGNLHETAIVLERPPACPFSNVRSDTVGRPHNLFSNRIALKLWPLTDQAPNFIREPL